MIAAHEGGAAPQGDRPGAAVRPLHDGPAGDDAIGRLGGRSSFEDDQPAPL